MNIKKISAGLAGERMVQLCRLVEARGLWKGVKIFYRMHGFVEGSRIQIPAGLVVRRPIELRKDNSDPEVFEQVFVERQYRGVWTAPYEPEWILDAGANVGLSALHFHEVYPSARILAIEPSPANFVQLLRNTRNIPCITPLNAALWAKEEHVVVANPAASGCALRVEKASGGDTTVPGYSVDHLMRAYGMEYIDLLKIDIEGAEKVVFDADTGWLSKVRVLAIELHDHVQAGCSNALFRALQGYAYGLRIAGENLVIQMQHATLQPDGSRTGVVV